MTTESKIKSLVKLLKLEDLIKFLNECPDNLIFYVLDEIETRVSPERFIEICEEF